MDEFDLAVIIPARNEEAYVGSALESVLEQRWPRDRLEAIVVANGCTDRTVEVVRGFAADNPDLAVVLVERDEPGVATAKNDGAEVARATRLVFLDADSRLHPELARRAASLDAAGVPAASMRLAASDGDLLDRIFYWLIEAGKVALLVRANMCYVRRDVFLAHGGFDPRVGFAEDLDFLQRIRRAGARVDHIWDAPVKTSARRLHQGRFRSGWLKTLARWTLVRFGIGRRWRY